MTKRVADMIPEELDRHRARDRERYAKHTEHRERRQTRMREYRRERYANDPEFRQRVLERKRKYQRERYASDPEYRERKRARERETYRRRKTGRTQTDRGVAARSHRGDDRQSDLSKGTTRAGDLNAYRQQAIGISTLTAPGDPAISTSSGAPSAVLERKRRLERERYAKQPEYRERRREQKREYKRTRYANDPGFREQQLLVIRERNRKRLATEAEYRERKRGYNREYRRREKAERLARV